MPASIRRRVEHRPYLLRIVNNIAWLTADKILRMGMGLVIGVLVARHLGPEVFGALSFALAFVGLLGPIAGLGLRQIVVRDMVSDPVEETRILGAAALLRVLGGLVTYALIVGVIHLLNPDDAMIKAMVLIIGLVVVFQTSELAAFWFEARVLSKYTVLSSILAFAIFAIVRITLLLLDAPVIAFAIATSAEAAVASLALMFAFLRKGPDLSGATADYSRARQLLRDSWPLCLSGIAVVVYMRIDQLMLGQMLDVRAVGIYNVAVKISEIWYFLPTIIAASLFPTIIATRARSEPEYYARLQRLFDLMVWLALAIALPMTFLATPLVSALFGAEYIESGTVLAIHIWAAVFVFLGVASSHWFVAENRQILSLKRTVLGAVVNIGLNLLLIPEMGAAGAAWATLASNAVAALLADAITLETRHLFRMKLSTLWPRTLWS